MKKYLLLVALCEFAVGCQKNEPALEEFTVKTLGNNSDCDAPMLLVLDRPEVVAKLVAGRGATYITYGLGADLGQAGQTLLVRVRKSGSSEALVCRAYGPSYPQLTVVSARLK